MKKIIPFTFAVCVAFFLASCGGGNSSKSSTSTQDTTQKKAAAPAAAASSMGVTTVNLTGNDTMKYNETYFMVKAGQQITLTMKNVGKLPATSMSHDVVVLKQGSDFKAFGKAATMAKGNIENLPDSLKSEIIAHTKMLGPGEADTITFTLPKPGYYPYLCTFPGHYLSMNGKLDAR